MNMYQHDYLAGASRWPRWYWQRTATLATVTLDSRPSTVATHRRLVSSSLCDIISPSPAATSSVSCHRT